MHLTKLTKMNILFLFLIFFITNLFLKNSLAQDVLDTSFSEDSALATENKKNSNSNTDTYSSPNNNDNNNLDNQAKEILLHEALDMGLRLNFQEKSRHYQRAQLEIKDLDNEEKFWYPNLDLKLITQPTLIDTLQEHDLTTNPTSKGANGSLGLELGEYTVFNWGKDYLEYQNNKYYLQRQKQQLYESRRRLKYKIIYQYYYSGLMRHIQRVRLEQLRHTGFLHRVAQEKLSLKKIDAQEFFQVKSEFLKAQALYQESSYEIASSDELLANTLGDRLDTTYKISSPLKFIVPNLSYNEAINFAGEKNPELLDAKIKLENANRSYEKTIKETMPLPKIGLNLGAYTYRFAPEDSNYSFETGPGNKNIELVASVNFTWNIFGEGGLFNSRTRHFEFLNTQIGQVEFINSKRSIEVKLQTLLKSLKRLERQVSFTQLNWKNSQLVFDNTLDNYLGGKTQFPNIKYAIDNLSESEIAYEQNKLEHLKIKLSIADLIGLDDLPGENFENLGKE